MDPASTADEIYGQALAAVNPATLFRQCVRREGHWLHVSDLRFDLSKINRLIVIGTGKGTAPMAQAAEEILGDRLTAGAITVKYGHALPLKNIQVFEAGHPLPDRATVRGTRYLLNCLRNMQPQDLVLVLISGGGSSLLEFPAPGITLQNLQRTTSALLACGAEIGEINVLRKHLSLAKGGQLLRFAAPAQVVTLAISDVLGDPPEAISSGPTVPDTSTFGEAWQIIQKYDLEKFLPQSVLRHIIRGQKGAIPDTPKPGEPIFEHAYFRIMGNNHLLLQAAAATAKKLGYRCFILTKCLRGEAREQGRRLAALMKNLSSSQRIAADKICLLAGGETTVTLKGQGRGGRCQELALSAARELAGAPHCLLMAVGTDGTDGPTEAAGARADGLTIEKALGKGMNAMDYLDRNDSNTFFHTLGDLVITGPTRTNVMDLVIMLVN